MSMMLDCFKHLMKMFSTFCRYVAGYFTVTFIIQMYH